MRVSRSALRTSLRAFDTIVDPSTIRRKTLSASLQYKGWSKGSHSHAISPAISRGRAKRIEIGRDTATNLPVLAECNWRFSVVEVDNSIVPNNSPKSKPLIGATRELLLLTIASIGADQSEDWIVGSFWEQRNCCHPLPPPNT